MTTAAQTKAKSDEELKNTFCLIMEQGASEARVLNIKNVSGTSTKTKITGEGSEKIEITYDPAFKSGSRIISGPTKDNMSYTDSTGRVYDSQDSGGLARFSVESDADQAVLKGDLENVRLISSDGKEVLLNGAVLAFINK